MDLDKVELLREVITFLKRFKDKDIGIKSLEILLEQDSDVEKILEAIRATNNEVSISDRK